MSNDLKPCPFCGCSTDLGQITTQGEKWGAIYCNRCAAYGPEVRTAYGNPETWWNDAVAEWNRRTAPASVPPSVTDTARLDAAHRQALDALRRRGGAEGARTEHDELALCDSLIKHAGGQRVNLSQVRPSRLTLGLPDRRYRLNSLAFWFECKPSDGKLTRAQYDFLLAEAQCNGLVLCGGLDDLSRYLRLLHHTHEPQRHARLLSQGLAVIEARGLKGFRGERKGKPSMTPISGNPK